MVAAAAEGSEKNERSDAFAAGMDDYSPEETKHRSFLFIPGRPYAVSGDKAASVASSTINNDTERADLTFSRCSSRTAAPDSVSPAGTDLAPVTTTTTTTFTATAAETLVEVTASAREVTASAAGNSALFSLISFVLRRF